MMVPKLFESRSQVHCFTEDVLRNVFQIETKNIASDGEYCIHKIS